MNSFFGCLRMDLRRAFLSRSFLLSTLGMAAVYLYIVFSELITVHSGSVYYLNMCMDSSDFSMLALLFCAVPYATSFCEDWNNQFVRPSCIRSGPGKYCASKIFVCAFSGGGTIVLAHILVWLILALKFPLFKVGDHSGDFVLLHSVLQGGHIVSFFICDLILMLLLYALLATIAFFISIHVPNIFVTLVSPLIIYCFLENFSDILKLPTWLDISDVCKGCNYFINSWVSMLYVLAYVGLLCTVIGMLTVHSIKRRLQHA
jgi:hypothetical protein